MRTLKLPTRLPVTRHPPAIARGEPGDERHDHGRDQCQLDIDHQHECERAGEGHHRNEQILGAVMGDLADLLQVLGDAGDEVARLVVVVEAEGEFLQVVEGLAAHVGLDVDAQHVAPIDHHGVEPRIGQIHAEQPRRGEQDERPVLRRQEIVDEELRCDREGELQEAGQDRAGKVQQEQLPVRCVVGKEASEHGLARVVS
jgi:hypothetical protein